VWAIIGDFRIRRHQKHLFTQKLFKKKIYNENISCSN
jgi:hypothetical protein